MFQFGGECQLKVNLMKTKILTSITGKCATVISIWDMVSQNKLKQ